MNLENLRFKETNVKLSLSVASSTKTMLDSYLKMAQETLGRGAEVKLGAMVEALLLTHMNDDKAFQKWLKDKAGKSGSERKGSAVPVAAAPAQGGEQEPEVAQEAQAEQQAETPEANPSGSYDTNRWTDIEQ